MAVPMQNIKKFNVPYDGTLSDGLIVLVTDFFNSKWHVGCSIYHGGAWEHLKASTSSYLQISNIEFSDNVLHITAQMNNPTRVYVCIIQSDGFPTT